MIQNNTYDNKKNNHRENKNPWKVVKRKGRRKKPITSFGIILFTLDKNGIPKYLLAQRRDTIEYVDFIRGHYTRDQLFSYFSLMSENERQRLLNYDFDELWKDLWINRDHPIYRDCYQHSKTKFLSVKNEIPEFIQNTTTNIKEPSWIFPKGKKNYRETSIECALREFTEETKINNKKIKILFSTPYIETFSGSNEKLYSTHYYVAYTPEPLKIKTRTIEDIVRKNKSTISEEVACMHWLYLEDAEKKLNRRRYLLLKKVHQDIMMYNMVAPCKEWWRNYNSSSHLSHPS